MSTPQPDPVVRTSDRQVPVVGLGVKLDSLYTHTKNIDISFAEDSPMILFTKPSEPQTNIAG